MSKIKYIVWIGGLADYEGNNLKRAKAIYNEWLGQGYDDVILEVL
jgi:hypothetical protein